MKRTSLILSLLITLFVGHSMAMADQTNLKFRHLGVDEGLSSNTINGIVQDKYGFIWIGTDEGLDRYDGTKISVFKLEKDVTRFSMSNAVIIYLLDSESNLWISSQLDNYIFDPYIGKFERFDVKTSNGERLPVDVKSATEDNSKNIWFATFTHGVYCYNLKTKKLVHYSNVNPFHHYSIITDENNQVWLTTGDYRQPILKLNRPRNIFQPVAIKNNPLLKTKSNFTFIYKNNDGNIYCTTWDKGLYKFNRSTSELTLVLNNSEVSPMTHVHCISSAKDNKIWIGSDDGLLLYDPQKNDCFMYGKDENSETSLSSKFVYQVCEDREGGVWVGTFYGGVSYAPPFQNRFASYRHSADKNSVGGSVIAGFCEDDDGNIWISSDDGGVSLYHPDTHLFSVYKTVNSGLSFDNTHALYADGKNIWIGTYTGGVNVLNTENNTWKHYHIQNSNLYDESCYAINKDSRGNLWVCNMTGICKYDYASDKFIRMHTVNSLVLTIQEDRSHNVWFGSPGGSLLCYTSNGKWKSYDCSNSDLPCNQINCLYLDENGVLWIATTKGLCKYDERNKKFVTYNLDAPSNNIQCILEINGQLWLTTTNGLICFVPSKNISQVYMKRDGLISCQFTMNSGLVASDGCLYVGSDKGFNSFYPNLIKKNEYIPPVVITGLMLMNKEVKISDDGPLKQSISSLDKIDLSYKDNVITINYASLSYCIPEKNQYTYYMEGFDNGWVKAGNRQSATYTNLSPGTYIFHVKGTNNDGEWNNQGTSLTIVIHPPFYLTWWAKLLYLIIFVLGIRYAFKKYKENTARKQDMKIEKVKQEKEKELYTAKISFFTMIAHEIRTPVSLIIGPMEQVLEKELPDALRSDLQTVYRNSKRLLFLVNQLLDFRKVQQGMFKMKFTTCDLTELVRATTSRFSPLAEQHGEKLKVNVPNDKLMVDIDKEAITKVLSNLLMNAIKYTHTKIEISCIQEDEKNFKITVTDNGDGMKEEEKQKIFKPFYQGETNKPGTGIGLTIVRNMIELHHGNIMVDSKFGEGTSFIVTLPIKQEHIDEERPIKEDVKESLSNDIINMENSTNTSNENSEKQLLLIVDDNEDMLTFLSQSFVDDYTIMTAENGEQALKLIDNNNFSLIISDWMMPVMDGAELCKAVRKNPLTSHIPFVLLTAKTDLDSKIEGMDIGADIFVEKPFSIHYLKSCIHNLIELRSMLIQKFSKMPLVPIKSIASHSEDERILNQINKIIEDNFSNPDLDVDLLAEKMNISRSSLYTKIKSISNQTPNELIQLLRLKKAAELLLEKKYRMNEICYMVGFSNPSYFSKCFLKQFGKRPSEYN